MRALIVDDSAAARAQARLALEEVLVGLGLPVVIDEAHSGMEALRLLASEDIQILVVDLHMPDITGLDVLSFWRGRSGAGAHPNRRAVVVSTEVSPRDREKSLAQGAHSFLNKPLSSDDLMKALQGVAGGVSVGRG